MKKPESIPVNTGQMNIYLELVDILDISKTKQTIDELYLEFLKKSCNHLGVSRGYFLFVDNPRLLTYPASATIIENIEVELKANLPFLEKYFAKTKDYIIGNPDTHNAAYNFLSIINCNSLLVLPLFFNTQLKAVSFFASGSKVIFTKAIAEVNMLADFFTLIADDKLIKDKNAALEARLIQTQKLETLSKLTASIAHDFSNLLSAIFGSVNLLRKKAPNQEDIKRLLDTIENSAVRGKDLTKGLLSYGKPTPKRLRNINTKALISEIVKIVQQTLPRTIQFENSVENNIYPFLGNDTEIAQVIINLCINAKEAIRDKGKITLKVRNIEIDDSNNHLFPLLIPGKYIRFTVRDNGEGISAENLQKIFDPYFSTKKKEQTSGLGLYVSYGIIKGHKGQIDVKSKVGKGTSFDIFLPALFYDKKEAAARDYKIILIADDEYMLLDLLAEMLESNDYNVIKVLSGKEAVKLLEEEIKADLIILDYNMPDMNGLECTTKIREFDKVTPIILSTGSMSLNNDAELYTKGITSIVPKPYEFETLLSTIKGLI